MVREDKTAWKASYFTKIAELFEEYPKLFIVGVDNVGSKQMQEIRIAMRGHAVILMGKNTMIRKAIRGLLAKNPNLEKLLPYIVQNVGFVFTKGDLSEIRGKLLENKRGAPAKAGAIAPCDVKLPPQNTGMGPEKTSFFQALQIPTKIARGTIEILNDVHLIKIGEKVGASEAALLNMLNIQPFSYGLVVLQVYDSGTMYSPSVLDLSTDDLRARFVQGARNIAAVSLSIGVPTLASVPHSLATGLQKMLGIAAVTDVTFKAAEKLKEFLADPSKFAVAAAPATATTTAVTASTAQKAKPARTVKDVPADKFVVAYAAHLKKEGKIQLPKWTDFVKTGQHKELAPYDPSWFYVRCASIARKIYLRGGTGVGAFRKVYGGSKARGTRQSHFVRGSGAICRAALKELERIKVVEKDPKGGRRITTTGQQALDRISSNIHVPVVAGLRA